MSLSFSSSSVFSPLDDFPVPPEALEARPSWEFLLSPLISSGKLAGVSLIDTSSGRWIFQHGLCTPENIPSEEIRACLENFAIEGEKREEKNSILNGSAAPPPASPVCDSSFSAFQAFQTRFVIYSRTFSSFYSISKYRRLGLFCHKMPFDALLITVHARPQRATAIIPWLEKQIAEIAKL